MCYVLKENEESKIADKDIVVYKIICSDGTPLHNYKEGFKYNFLSRFFCKKVNIKVQKSHKENIIFEGYHSYRSLEYAKGIRVYSTIIRKFIIPKGTKYYCNNNEYVSERILMRNKIK